MARYFVAYSVTVEFSGRERTWVDNDFCTTANDIRGETSVKDVEDVLRMKVVDRIKE